jgi:hypothetical protein
MLTFPGQRENEKILMVIRKHPIVYIRIIVVSVIFVGLPLMFLYLFAIREHLFADNNIINALVILFACLYALYGMLFTCMALMDEQFDLFIVTNDRLIDITQVTILKSTVSSTPLKHIQDTTSSLSGLFQTFINYGDIEVQTAGNSPVFHIDRVPDPSMVARKILNYARESRGELLDEKLGEELL